MAMSLKEETTTSALAIQKFSTASLANFDASVPLIVDLEKTSFLDIVRTVKGEGVDLTRYQAVVTGRVPYWGAEKGAVLAGRIINRFEIQTEFGTCGLYTIELNAPAHGVTPDGEIRTMQAGEQMVVLERFLLKDFAKFIGQNVICVCAGKRETKAGNSVWDYQWAVELPEGAPAANPALLGTSAVKSKPLSA
jgi:hypothetical protein